MNLLGNNLKQLRLQKEWTLAEAATRIKISAPAMSKIENGQSDITLSRLYQLLELYDVPINTILGVNDDSPSVLNQLNAMQLRLKERDAEIELLRRKLIALHVECQSG